MYCARTVAENGEKDAFSVISDDEWNPYHVKYKARGIPSRAFVHYLKPQL